MRAVFYHGVVDRRRGGGHLDRLFADVHDFEGQVAQIARRCHAVSLAELHDHLAEHQSLPAGAVHVSIDDGFRNTLTAAEILERHRLPWTLFVVVDAVLDGYQPWYVRVADAIDASTNARDHNGEVHDLTTPAGRRRFARRVKATVMAADVDDVDEVVADMLALPGIQPSVEPTEPFLTIDELRQLHAAGVEIGNHSARHLNLNRCRDEQLTAEVDGARDRLAAALGAPVRFFSYPDGRHSRRVRRRVGTGHDLAMATWSVGRELQPLAIRRLDATGTPDLDRELDRSAPVRHAWAGARWELPVKARERWQRLR